MQDRWEGAKLDELLDGMSRMEFTLRFTLSDPNLDTTIVGTRSVEHLKGTSPPPKRARWRRMWLPRRSGGLRQRGRRRHRRFGARAGTGRICTMGAPTVGIVGAGQLARMLHESASALGINTVVLANAADEAQRRSRPVSRLDCPCDLEALRRLARRCDVGELSPTMNSWSQLTSRRWWMKISCCVRARRHSKWRSTSWSSGRLRSRRIAGAGLGQGHGLGDGTGLRGERGWPVVGQAARGGYDGRGVWIRHRGESGATDGRRGRVRGRGIPGARAANLRCSSQGGQAVK